MAARLSTIVSHLKNDEKSLAFMGKTAVVHDIMQELDVSVAKLNQIIVHFITAMMLGLKKAKGPELKMLPSFVYNGATDVTGSYLALDLGGTNFRVIYVRLENGKLAGEAQVDKFAIPAELMHTAATGDMLFDFIALSVAQFLEKHAVDNAPSGFTFSFPVQQTEIDSGRLLNWTKGFSTQNTVGKDVVALLRAAFARASVKVSVRALVNDTVGTLVAGYFADRTSEVGVIIGTGSNACYWEAVPQITKLPSPSGWSGGSERMCVNMEWGNFDSEKRCVLPTTEMDRQVDDMSPNAGSQRLEKMVSGMYLGEIGRLILLRLIRHGILPTVPSHVPPMSLTSAHLSCVLADGSPDLGATRRLFHDLYRYELSVEEAAVIKMLFTAVATRSARLSAGGVAAILLKTGRVRDVQVCIDGSVFEKMPGYKQVMEEALDAVMKSHGIEDPNIRLVHTDGGSGLGAAFIAALASRK
uniref:Phosphotransferase n=1 Tax=Diplonema papillatum TaxID=91374 RepID=A0A0B6VU00_9EUGL|nr:hexokinase [Diplonema papillatum]